MVFEADAEALKDGIMVERSWNMATVHNVTDDELAVGAAVVVLPAIPRPITVELRFESGVAPGRSHGQDDLAEHGARLEQSVSVGDLGQR